LTRAGVLRLIDELQNLITECQKLRRAAPHLNVGPLGFIDGVVSLSVAAEDDTHACRIIDGQLQRPNLAVPNPSVQISKLDQQAPTLIE
jgi:hypothetical protein